MCEYCPYTYLLELLGFIFDLLVGVDEPRSAVLVADITQLSQPHAQNLHASIMIIITGLLKVYIQRWMENCTLMH